DDWLELDYLEIGQLLAPARALTLRDSTAGIALAWLQHRDYTWEAVAAGAARQPVQLRYHLYPMPPRQYSRRICNPLTGAVVGHDLVLALDDGILSVDLFPLHTLMALRIFRQPESLTAQPSAAIPPTYTLLPTQSPTQTADSSPTRTPVIAQTNT